MDPRWRIIEPETLRWRAWDGETLVFHEASGDTHLIDPFIASLLQRMTLGRGSVSELVNDELLWGSVDDPAQTLAQRRVLLFDLLRELDELGIVERIEP